MTPEAQRRFDALLAARRATADRLMLYVLLVEWGLAVALTILFTPYTFAGPVRELHLHVKLAIGLGAALNSLPILLIIKRPGWWVTRQVVTVAQMLWSALLIHLTGGRIETHFHVFVSLAFLSFYRDWRLFPTATFIVIVDHLLRGLLFPESVYGIANPEWWRFLEHGGWVVFEDVVLILGCVANVRDLREVAEREAALDHTNATLAARIKNRTAALSATNVKLKQSFEELGRTQRQLVDASRRAGMAEVATSVLHNVGNVLNSLNVSANLVKEGLERSPSLGIVRVNKLVAEHIGDLFAFLVADERGKQLPNYLDKLAGAVSTERDRLIGEMGGLQRSIDHIKTIVALQQKNAKFGGLVEEVELPSLLEDAIAFTLRHEGDGAITVERSFAARPPLPLHRHKIMDIVVNLLQNARRAVFNVDQDHDGDHDGQREKRITVRCEERLGSVAISVTDTGVGIPAENLAKIFTHGFTTHAEGHGFGLHASANSASAMGGTLTAHSDGPGHGATFTLVIPTTAARAAA